MAAESVPAMSRTPNPVVAAIHVIGAYLRDEQYGSAIIAPGGGASFHLRNVLDEKDDLFKEIARLQTDLELTKAALIQARGERDTEKRAREIAQAQLRAIADAEADALTDQEFARRVRKIMKG